MLANHKKGIFLLKRAFVGERQRPVSRPNFKIKVGDTLIIFTYVQFTFMLHYRTHGVLVENYHFRRQALQSYTFSLREQHLAKI